MDFKKRVKKALDKFMDYWDGHNLPTEWHRPIKPLLEIYNELQNDTGESGQFETHCYNLGGELLNIGTAKNEEKIEIIYDPIDGEVVGLKRIALMSKDEIKKLYPNVDIDSLG